MVIDPPSDGPINSNEHRFNAPPVATMATAQFVAPSFSAPAFFPQSQTPSTPTSQPMGFYGQSPIAPTQQPAIDQPLAATPMIEVWSNQILAMENVRATEMDPTRIDTLTKSITMREKWIDSILNPVTQAQAAHPPAVRTVHSLREPKINSLKVGDDVASWSLNFGEMVDGFIQDHRNQNIPITDDMLRRLWSKYLPVSEEYADLLRSMANKSVFNDSMAVLKAFREFFADYSMGSLYFKFMSVVWKPSQPFSVFANQFSSYVESLGLKEDVIPVRGLVAQR
ncbi:hypothetical protein BGZ76_005873, partial [Entomortierella beljakovae]